MGCSAAVSSFTKNSRKDIRHLALKVSALILATGLSYLTLLGVCLRHVTGERTYPAAQLDKIELLRKTPSPRLVFVGGSNLALGVDSPLLSGVIGLPVVNMGLHAGLGLRYMLDCTTPLLRRGDLVVVVPEYEQFTGRTFDGGKELLRLFAFTLDRNIFWRVSPSILLEGNEMIFLWKGGATASAVAAEGKEFLYTRDSFNRNGDVVSHLGRPNVPFKPAGRMNANLNQRAVSYLATFIEEQNRRRVTTIFVFPCLMTTYYQANRATISKIVIELQRRIPQTRSIAPEEFVYDDRYFFDTEYHLNADGRKRRTEDMIEVLNRSVSQGFWRR